jgi:tetratricopeptide (TPR) repeat protein
MRRALLVVAIAACGSKSSRSTLGEKAPPEERKSAPLNDFPAVSALRPTLDIEHLVPDFHEELRWPLSPMRHPELEPQFEIASVFAQPGIGWIELCDRGITNRVSAGRNRDELEYLRGWCAAIKGDADTACRKLAPLTSSAVLGIPAAVRTDLANIIANAGNIDTADRLINQHRIDDFELMDTLSATYLEIGNERDAFEINRRALDNDVSAKPALQCRRIVKAIALGGQSDRVRWLGQLSDLATNPKVPDETCVALRNAARCFVGRTYECEPYFRAQSINTRYTYLLAAYQKWPSRGHYWDWLDIVITASAASDIQGADELATVALDAALRSAPSCFSKVLRTVKEIAGDAQVTGTLREKLENELVRCKWDVPVPADRQSATHDSDDGNGSGAAPAATPAVQGPDCSDFVVDSKDGACKAQYCRENLDAPDCQQLAVAPAPASCDAEAAKEKGVQHVNMGQHAYALAAFEESLRCKDDENVRALAFMQACASHSSPKAKYYYKRITPLQQGKLRQMCERETPPVKYEPSCDWKALHVEGINYKRAGKTEAALESYEKALQCKDDPQLRASAFMLACVAHDSAKARLHYRLLEPKQQTKFAQICKRQKPPVGYE